MQPRSASCRLGVLVGLLVLAFGLAMFDGLSAASAALRRSDRVPSGFIGMNLDGPLFSPQVDLDQQLGVMVSSGVERVRTAFSWAAAQPFPSYAAAPADVVAGWTDVHGVPTDFSQTDLMVSVAARRGLRVLPTVLYAPRWAAEHPGAYISPPADPATYARFLSALVFRYGPRGAFWTEHPTIPKLPISWWQIWNEPDLPLYWPDQPKWEPGYVALLHAAHDALKAADPHSTVIMAGTPDYTWTYLRRIYRIPGSRRWFDVAAVHPYTAVPGHVVGFLALVRQAMDDNGDRRKPMIVTELSFPSSKGKTSGYSFATDEHGQAVNTATTMTLLAHRIRRFKLLGIYIFTWIGAEPAGGTFGYSGLFRISNSSLVAKPVYVLFRRTALSLEGCRVKGPTVSRCLR